MKKILIPAVFCLSLTACGGSAGGGDSAVAPTPTPTPAPTPTPTPTPTISEHWQLVWSDEFNGDSIDSTKWSHEKNCTGGGNNELQCYTDREQNSFVANGLLNIVARQENFSGQSQNDDAPNYDPQDASVTRNYTSARLRTKHQGDWRYGRMEISAQLPQGQGIWPAIWMLPTEWKYGAWPASGEIDIMEAVNSNTGATPNDIHGTLHYGKFWPENTYSGAAKTVQGNAWEGQHIYAVEWEREEIRWYLDGVHYATQRPATDSANGWFTYYWKDQTEGYSYGTQGAPFDEQFHLILNLAVGGNWPGNPNPNTQFPQTFSIDYVRVYECAPEGVASADGSGCGTNTDPNIQPIGTQRPAQNSFTLFANGLQPLPLTSNGGTVDQPLDLASWSAVDGNVVTETLVVDSNTLWQTTFYGAGNSFIRASASPVADTQTGLQLINVAQYGELKFDIKIISAAPETQLTVKIDSGWPNLSEYQLDGLTTNQWTSVSVPLSQLQENSVEAGQVNFNAVQNPFVIEATGPAQIQINNLRLICLANCRLAPVAGDSSSEISETVTIFDETINSLWNLGILTWQEVSPHILVDLVAATDVARGQVIDVAFTGTNRNGLMFIQTDTTQNMTAFADSGFLEFDIKVIDYAAATSLKIKADCVHPCSSGDIDIGQPGMHDWETVQVPVSDLVSGGLDLTKVNTPFALLPAWSEQAGVHLQLDNIKWVLP